MRQAQTAESMQEMEKPASNGGGWLRVGLRWLARAGVGLVMGLLLLWATGALWFDSPWPAWRGMVVAVWLAGLLMVLVKVRPWWRCFVVLLAVWAAVVGWWLTLQPRNDRDWLADVDRTAWAEVNGDEVVFHQVRNFDYRSPTDYTPRWETRRVRLSALTGMDLFIDHWSSKWMAHPIVSFQFADQEPLAVSIETRKEKGEVYSAVGGFYRMFELVYVLADERDVVRLRTNYRKGEQVRFYRLRLPLKEVRERFMEYVEAMNDLHARPSWYNAMTMNCTTAVRSHHPASERAPWDWRMLINGKMDEMLYETGLLETGGMGFEELRERALINGDAVAADGAADFWRRIREGRLPGDPGGASTSGRSE